MKKTILALLAIAAPLAATQAEAAGYPWCSDYNNMVKSCGASTHQQCKDAASGNGGECIPNPWYQPPVKTSLRWPRKRS
ncbi:MAG: DUF3551 domain-containing protein [Xanthobacteraceae bacterium]